MKTKTLNVTCSCMATYSSSIEVPADMSLEDAIKYAKEHIDRINVTELEYVYDSDSINEGSCSFLTIRIKKLKLLLPLMS